MIIKWNEKENAPNPARGPQYLVLVLYERSNLGFNTLVVMAMRASDVEMAGKYLRQNPEEIPAYVERHDSEILIKVIIWLRDNHPRGDKIVNRMYNPKP